MIEELKIVPMIGTMFLILGTMNQWRSYKRFCDLRGRDALAKVSRLSYLASECYLLAMFAYAGTVSIYWGMDHLKMMVASISVGVTSALALMCYVRGHRRANDADKASFSKVTSFVNR